MVVMMVMVMIMVMIGAPILLLVLLLLLDVQWADFHYSGRARTLNMSAYLKAGNAYKNTD